MSRISRIVAARDKLMNTFAAYAECAWHVEHAKAEGDWNALEECVDNVLEALLQPEAVQLDEAHRVRDLLLREALEP